MRENGVIGTAGHIDHGKTALVHALTGVDTDRLQQEKARGITIELGFAHLALPSGRTVGVVDVPGHERYLRAMVAGAMGFDLVVLVVAADESVMPQTREHLAVCELLGIERAVVALTKIDIADETMRKVAEDDVRALLVRTVFADAPIVPCSARTGEGLPALRSHLDTLLASTRSRAGRDVAAVLRIPIDRVFTMKGFGSVVTGTLWAGRIAIDDEVSLYPEGGDGSVKVRGLQRHGAAITSAAAGERVAVNVGWPKERIARGQVLGHVGTLAAARTFDARLRLLTNARKPLRRRNRVRLHVGTVQVEATVRLLEGEQLLPGTHGWVEIEADEAVVLLPGDRFVLRGSQPQRDHGTTLGGGDVVRVMSARSRRGARTEPALLEENFTALRDGDVARRVLLEVERAGKPGITRQQLLQRVPYSMRALDDGLAELSSKRSIMRFDRERGAHIASSALQTLRDEVLAIVDEHHRATPVDEGVPRESLRATVTEDPRLLQFVIETLRHDREIELAQDRLRRPGHAAREDGAASDQLLARLANAGLEPPRLDELDKTPEAKAALMSLVKQGRVVRCKDLYFAATAITTLRERLVAHLEQQGQIDAQGWKALSGVSRKFSIPLAEYFDAEKVTLRVGDTRKLRRV